MSEYGKPVFGKVSEQFPIVKTLNGKIIGETRDHVAIFRGIPYGGSVKGSRRFQAPTEAESWTGIKDCTRNGPISVQPGESIQASKNFSFYFSGGHPENFGVRYERQDEDCLVLNVVTPGIDDEKRPVIVYIHGGGYATNSGITGIGSDVFSREQNAVVVSMNHRLHIWGYLYLAEFDERFRDSGNAGSLDLILALKWVKANIEKFGGDPDNITVMGESGGGAKINTLLHMKEAAGLINKAIITSGSMPTGVFSKETATDLAERYLHTAGIGKNELNKLFYLPADYLMWKAFEVPGADLMIYQPCADEIHLPAAKGSGFEPAEFYRNIPMIIGASEDEMAAFCAEVSFDVTAANLREKLLKVGPSYGIPANESNVDEIIKVFLDKNFKMDAPDHMFMKMLSVAHVLNNGAYHQALACAKENTAPVYSYLNRLDVPHNYITSRRYAWHTFDTPLGLRIVPYAELEDLSRTIAGAWGQFMRNGDPSTEQLQWLAFTEDRQNTMVFDTVNRLEINPLKEERGVIEKYL